MKEMGVIYIYISVEEYRYLNLYFQLNLKILSWAAICDVFEILCLHS